MKEILDSIKEIQSLIFEFDIKAAMNKVTILIENLIVISSKLSDTALNRLMGIINSMNTALGNKDYLLYNDILEFELKPFLESERKS